MATRYDGNPNVAFIDVGPFGVWGEGHTAASSRVPEDRMSAIIEKHIDLYANHFKHKLVDVNDDEATSEKPGWRFPETDYALPEGFTLGDDNILAQPPPHSGFCDEMALAFWPHLPLILEHELYGGSKQGGVWVGSLLRKSVEDYRASCMSTHWRPREELS